MMSYLVQFMLGMELYHMVSHICVLTGWRQLPRKDLVHLRWYFAVDLLSVLTSFLLHGRWWPVILTQNLQHAYYFLCWDESGPAKRVISWSSLDWSSEKRPRWLQLDLVSGTAFDIVVHMASSYFLADLLTAEQILFSLMLTVLLSFIVLFNPKLAWADRNGSPPDWVKRRLRPLTQDQTQDIPILDKLFSTFKGAAQA